MLLLQYAFITASHRWLHRRFFVVLSPAQAVQRQHHQPHLARETAEQYVPSEKNLGRKFPARLDTPIHHQNTSRRVLHHLHLPSRLLTPRAQPFSTMRHAATKTSGGSSKKPDGSAVAPPQHVILPCSSTSAHCATPHLCGVLFPLRHLVVSQQVEAVQDAHGNLRGHC